MGTIHQYLSAFAIIVIYSICCCYNAKIAVAETGDKTVFRKTFILTLIKLVVTTAVILVVFSQLIMLDYIPSGSMEGTIEAGDMLIATRYNKTDIERYDIMVFIPPDSPDEYYIKRVIGLPGETIEIIDGHVYADGVELDNSFVKEAVWSGGDGVYEVPEGCYFMLGDNRNNSYDSRYWETTYVPLENFVAKALVTILPFNRFALLIW